MVGLPPGLGWGVCCSGRGACVGPGLGGPVGGGPGGWGVVGGSLGIAALEGCQCVRHQGGDPDTFANGRGGRFPADFFAVSRSLGRLP